MDTISETFVDAFGEISLKHGMIRIELVSLSGSEPRVTQRLITSLQAFSQMLQAQNGMREQLEKAGVIRSLQPSPVAEPGSQPTSSPPVGEERGGDPTWPEGRDVGVPVEPNPTAGTTSLATAAA